MAEPVGAKIFVDDEVYIGDITEPAAPGLLTVERCALVTPGGWYSERKRSFPLHRVREVIHGEFTWGKTYEGWFNTDGKPIID